MFDKGKTEKYEEKTQSLYKDVSTQLKATGYSYQRGDSFYTEYSDFISKLTSTFEHLQNFCQDKLTDYAQNQEETRAKAKKDSDFARDSEEFIKVKTEELIKKNKFLDELRSKMKENLALLNPKKIAKLRVKETENLNKLFSTVFLVYYKDSKEPFEWTKFKNEAVVKDNLEDFQVRLINIDFTTLPHDQLQSLITIKDDPWVKDYVTAKKEGEAIIELINYFEFIKEFAATQIEINDILDKINRIKVDAPKRAEQAKIESNWAEVRKENITHLEEVNNRMIKSAEPFAEEVKRTDDMFASYDEHKKKLHNIINQEYHRLSSVPSSLYKAEAQ